MNAAAPPDSAGAALALLFIALLISLIIKFFWWLLAAVVLAVSAVVIRVFMQIGQRRQLAAARFNAEIAHGPDGDALIGSVAPGLYLPPPSLTDDPPVAAVAYSEEALDALLDERRRAWPWAAFCSVLVQRRAAVKWRCNDLTLAFPPPHKKRLRNRAQVGQLVAGCVAELCELNMQVNEFMLTPAFMGMFGDPGDETTADADGIVHTANRLMDFHDRFLELAERCQSRSAPPQYAELLDACELLTRIPLQNYHRFVDDFVALVDGLPELLHFADAGAPGGVVEAGPVQLNLNVDDQLLWQITRRLTSLSRAERFAEVAGRLFAGR